MMRTRPLEQVKRILTCNEICEYLESNNKDTVIALDTEGTNIEQDYRDGRGYGIGLSITLRVSNEELVGGYYPFRHPKGNLSDDERFRLSRAIENFRGWFVFHNAKHDLVALHTMGIDYKGKFYCTLLMAHLLNETLPYSKSLDACVQFYLGKDEHKDDAELKAVVAGLQGQWHLVPVEFMAKYATHDTALTYRLFEVLAPRVFAEVPREYWEHKQEFVRTIIKMESRGVRVDVDLCKRMTAIGETQMAEVVELLGLNPGSPKDQYELFIERLKLPVLKRTPKGKVCFDKEVMEQYEEILENRPNPDTTAELVLAYRGWQKATSGNYKPYVALLSPDGRLRTNYKLHGTKTGRMSSEKPNLQNIPRISDKIWNGNLKSAFIPEANFELWEFDYSQLEFRLGCAYAAQYQPNIPLLEIFNDDSRDIFTEMSKIEKWPRQNIKIRTYTIQFGGGATRLSNVFGVSIAEGERIKQQFFEQYPGFAAVMKKASNKARSTGRLQLWSGRYRHFMYPDSEAHKGFNAVIQGGAADIVNKVMVRLYEEIDNDVECRMLLQVHDSLLFEIRKDKVEEYKQRIIEIMEDIKPDFGVRFRVDAHEWSKE